MTRPPLPPILLHSLALLIALPFNYVAGIAEPGPLRQSSYIAAVAFFALAVAPRWLRHWAWCPALALATVLPWVYAQRHDEAALFNLAIFTLAATLWSGMGLRRPKSNPEASSTPPTKLILGCLLLLAMWFALAAMGAALSQQIWTAPSGSIQANLVICGALVAFHHLQFYLRSHPAPQAQAKPATQVPDSVS